MTRTPLPLRRQNRIVDVVHEGKKYAICVGFDSAGMPREVFADGHKEGSQMQALLDDACVVVSLLLQFGAQPEQLRHSIGWTPAFHDGREVEAPASLIGSVISVLHPIRVFDADLDVFPRPDVDA